VTDTAEQLAVSVSHCLERREARWVSREATDAAEQHAASVSHCPKRHGAMRALAFDINPWVE